LDTVLPIRKELIGALKKEWERFGQPGTWWSAEERVAIASEVREAANCQLCVERKAAISPRAIQGEHLKTQILSANVVDVIHRIVTDNGRLTKEWYKGVISSDLSETQFVEIVGIIATVITADTFSRAVGSSILPFPEPVFGEPSRIKPAGTAVHSAWVPTIVPEMAEDEEIIAFYNKMKEKTGYLSHIMRAMTLVPKEHLGFISLMFQMYILELSIDRPQVELIATTVSWYNDCFY
jgi:hypothetical protein